MLGVFAGMKEGRIDLEAIRFGGMSVSGARPRETMSLPDSHVHCMEHLKRMDSVCDEYFGAVVGCLPRTVSGKDYQPAPGPSLWTAAYFDLN
jgi:hypothetical protein